MCLPLRLEGTKDGIWRNKRKIFFASDQTAVLRNAEIFAADLAIAVNAELCYVHVSLPKPGDSGDETKKIAVLRSATVIIKTN